MPNTTFGMILTYGDFAVIKLFAGASLKPRSIRSSNSAMQHLEVDAMDQLGVPGEFLIAAFIGPLFSERLIYSSPLVINVKKLEWQLPEGMKCPNSPSYYVKFLMCGVEVIATKTNDAKVVVYFLKSNFFCWLGVPKVLISDQGSHFYNRAMTSLRHKYGVMHRTATAYHPQTNGQAEVFNREIEKILQKMTKPNRKD
ncbi:gag-pol, partial [Mucuna pruriens]